MQKGKQKASPVRHKEGGASAWTGGTSKTGKRKRSYNKDNSDGDDGDDSSNNGDDNNDDAFRDNNELTAQNWVQQVSCNSVAYKILLIGRFSVRLGHTPSKLMELSLFCTPAITK